MTYQAIGLCHTTRTKRDDDGMKPPFEMWKEELVIVSGLGRKARSQDTGRCDNRAVTCTDFTNQELYFV